MFNNGYCLAGRWQRSAVQYVQFQAYYIKNKTKYVFKKWLAKYGSELVDYVTQRIMHGDLSLGYDP